MSALEKLTFVPYERLKNNDHIAVRRRKLIAKIDEQISLANNPDYKPTKHKWVTDEDGGQRRIEVPKRLKPWWSPSTSGKINLVIRYGSKPIEFAKGKSAIELSTVSEVAETLRLVRSAVEAGELDALIEKHIAAPRSIKRRSVK